MGFRNMGLGPKGPQLQEVVIPGRGQDFVFCFSQDDLHQRLHAEMLEDIALEASLREKVAS